MADTITNRMLLAARQVHHAVSGFTVGLPDGTTAQAIVSSESMLDPDSVLGADPREYITVEFIKPFPALASQQEIIVNGERMKIVKREDNPSNPFAKFWAVKP